MASRRIPSQNLKDILDSPTYLLAEEDTALLRLPPLRALRLQLEYEKPELILSERGIRTTIVL